MGIWKEPSQTHGFFRVFINTLIGIIKNPPKENAMETLEFYFDFTSPYTYLTATQLPRMAAQAGVTLEYVPALLGVVIEQSGNRIPAVCQNKARYMMVELQDIAGDYGVPIKFPGKFPIMSLTALRATLVLAGDLRQEEWINKVFEAYWVNDQDISQDDVLEKIAEVCELNWTHLKRETQNPDIKEKLKEITNSAVKRGLFGMPTMFYKGKMYFGNESLPRVGRALGLKDWMAVP